MPTERAGAKALLIGTKIYLFGGSDSLQMISAIDVYHLLLYRFDT